MNGPTQASLPGGGTVDIGAGGRATFNPPYNVNVTFGQLHFAEDLAVFHCPSWMTPFPAEANLSDWIGVRCRTITTPQAAVEVKGTELAASVTSTMTVIWVYSGQIEVSDLAHRGAVLVGPGQMTAIEVGHTPSSPASFDASDRSLRWWDTASPLVIGLAVAVAMVILGLLYFLPTMIAAARRRRLWWAIGLLNLALGWTGAGWIASFVLALMLRDFPGERVWWSRRADPSAG